MPNKLKVAIVGVGGIAGMHVPGWQAAPDAELVAGCDINQDVLTQWAKPLGITKLFTDPAELFADADIDIIDICTPNGYHTPLTIAALEAGKHVICEKPLAVTPGEIRKMIAARDKSGKQLMTAQHLRCEASAKAVKAEIDKGVLGSVYHARCWILRRSNLVPTATYIIKQNAGGGPCIDIGVHILDLTMWLMGDAQPVTVSGVARLELANQPDAFVADYAGQRIGPDYDVEDFAAGFVRFDNGATLILETSWMLHHDIEGTDMQVWLYGTQGGCHWPRAEFYSSDNPTKQHYNHQLKCGPQVIEAHAQQCIEFAAAIASGAPSPVPPEQSLHVMQILDGIYNSQKAGAEVRID
jgi:predicted dehydrogenase